MRPGLTQYRRDHVGFVFQFYNLVPSLTARENVALVTEIARRPMTPDEALALVGLSDRADHFPAQLSGGEQQRVAIARAIAKNPEVLLCDEPTGALDCATGIRVLEALTQVNRTVGATTLVITHNAAIRDIADRVVRFADGRIVEETVNATGKQPGGGVMVIAPLRRKVLRDLRRLWAQVLAIALVLAAGVATLILGNGAYASLYETRARYYDSYRFADVFADVTRAPRALMGEIAGHRRRAGRRGADREAGAARPAAAWSNRGRSFWCRCPTAGGLNRLHLRQGRLPDPQSAREVVVSEGFRRRPSACGPVRRWRGDERPAARADRSPASPCRPSSSMRSARAR